MRSLGLYILVSVAASVVALADPVPFDPQILIEDPGGSAPPIDFTGQPITLVNGGGIFAFHNVTGNPLNEIDVNLDFPQAPLPLGFTVQGTILVPPSTVTQQSKFAVTTFSGLDCSFAKSSSLSCIELKFFLKPGPLIPVDGDFVLDFNDISDNPTGADLAVEKGTWTPEDGQGNGGSWGNSFANVDPIPQVPEPSYRVTAGVMGLALLAVWNLRRRSLAKKS
jgi:hypothetical protein